MKINYIVSEIIDQYKSDDRPWIIGYSGGKDSTILLQLVWYALRKISIEERTKKIHVVCNNTLVENPRIVSWTRKNLESIKEQSIKDGIPIVTSETSPKLDDSFWVNLIGKGYPTPNSSFRWCTERLKINPTTEYIKQEVDSSGEVIILLGTRKDESASRKKNINAFSIKNSRLSRHINLDFAYIYAPISDLTTNQVWEYLMQVPNPWMGTNRELITLYKNGSGGDCPLVIDTSTASCGKSRFGCWVCTVVKKDKSMEALVDNGFSEFEPLLDFRDWLIENRDKDEYRMMKLRNGGEGKGPYNIETRKYLLRRLLSAQLQTKEQLITVQELKAIEVIWQMDGFNESSFTIYNQIYESAINTTNMSNSKRRKVEQATELKTHCEKQGVSYEAINLLLSNERDKRFLRKRIAMPKIIDQAITDLVNSNRDEI